MTSNRITGAAIAALLLALTAFVLIGSACSAPTNYVNERDLTKIPLNWALQNGRPTLADFGWRDCIPCKMMKPVLETLAEKQRGRLNVLIVEVYDHEDLMDAYGVTAIPTQVLFDDQGKELTRHKGYWAPEEIAVELGKVGIN